MPKTASNPIALGSPAADFSLRDAGSALHTLASYGDHPALLVAFISNRCPFVLLIREEFARFAREYAGRGLAIVAINANDDAAHPEETIERMEEEARVQGYAFAYLKDPDQSVARAFGAACTPDLFLFGPDRRLAYHGQFDDARPGNGRPVTGADLRLAVEAVLAGTPVKGEQVPSIGCNIKWRPGNEPAQIRTAA